MKPRSPLQSFGVVAQVKTAAHPRNRLATAIGVAFGGFVPVASYVLVHRETAANPYIWILVTGGLIFSARTVFDWATMALRNPIKALGFVVLTEGVMTFSHTAWLSGCALGLLIAVNGLATGCNLVVKGVRS